MGSLIMIGELLIYLFVFLCVVFTFTCFIRWLVTGRTYNFLEEYHTRDLEMRFTRNVNEWLALADSDIRTSRNVDEWLDLADYDLT
jgi:hypothetical protein